MKTSFRAPSDDDYDGVDVTYINPVTWAEEIVQCRTTDNPVPRKVESYSLGIVMTADRVPNRHAQAHEISASAQDL
jgi:hypothetical protein